MYPRRFPAEQINVLEEQKDENKNTADLIPRKMCPYKD